MEVLDVATASMVLHLRAMTKRDLSPDRPLGHGLEVLFRRMDVA
jgi:hypothetical protein